MPLGILFGASRLRCSPAQKNAFGHFVWCSRRDSFVL